MGLDTETTYRFLHILSGITWIGLLYFFNLVNLPALKFQMKKPYEVDMGAKATPDLALKTLWWFRWGAMATLIFGLLLLNEVYIASATPDQGMMDWLLETGQGNTIFAGMFLGVLMWINVWFIIWPNQKAIMTNNKNLADDASEADKKAVGDENAQRLKTAVLASRFNFWASIPMLFFMVYSAHAPGALFG